MNHNTMMMSMMPGINQASTLKLIKNTEVTFNLTCSTKYGERIALIGSLPLLGHWDTNKAVYLDTNPQIYPVWSIKIDLPRDKIIEYKYLVITDIPSVNKASKPTIKWESLPPNINRIINTHGKKEIVVYESLTSLESIEEYVEVTANQKKFMSNSDQDSFKMEDFEKVHAKDPRLVKLEKRKIQIDEEDEDDGYRDSDSMEADDERSHLLSESTLKKIDLKNKALPVPQKIPQVSSQRVLDHRCLNEQSMGSLSSIYNQQDAQVDPNEPKIIASFTLPFQIQRDPIDRSKIKIVETYQHPIFLFASLRKMTEDKKYNFKWVGLLTTEIELTTDEKHWISDQLKPKQCYPIFITLQELLQFMRFYNNCLKTIFHNFKSLYEDYSLIESPDQWAEYIKVNMLFAHKIMELRSQFASQNLKQIWIHGDQLLMVPHYIRKKFVEANIGFFFHTPFPSSGIFRMFQNRVEILNSLLHCDLVGFHLFEYARNFLMTCHRMLGLEYEFIRGGYLAINNHGKNVMIRVSHIGIDEDFFENLLKSKNYRKQVKLFKIQFEQIKSLYKDNSPIIISSINSCHPISGVQNKLMAYHEFLKKYPNYRNKLCLIQYSTPNISHYENKSQHIAEKYQSQIEILDNYRKKVREMVDQIHREFGLQTLFYYEDNPSLEKRLALWSQTNILMVSNLKDGLCLPPLEYTITKKFTNKFESSLMLISEFSGANRAFTGFLEFNPFNISEFLMKLDQGLSMSNQEKGDLMKQAYAYVQKTSTSKWVDSFLKDLKYAYKPSSVSYYLGDQNINLDMNLRVIYAKSELRKLNIFECDSNFAGSKRCVIFLDHEAIPTVDYAQDAMRPIKSTLEDLEEIALDSRNTVIIFSNQGRNAMSEYFDLDHSNIWFVAESGYLYKTGPGSEWQQLIHLAKKVWVNSIYDLMQVYTQNVDGSVVEERQSTLVWNYKNAEEEQGNIVAKELYGQIKTLLGNAPVEIVQGRGYLEVKPIKLKKQKLVKVLLEKASQSLKIDYMLYLGTDTGNEIVYNFLRSKKSDHFFNSNDNRKYICTLGKKPSCASNYLDDIDEVKILLNKLRHSTQKRKRTRSYADLKSIVPLDHQQVAQKITRVDRSSNNLFSLFHHQTQDDDDEEEGFDDDDDQDFSDEEGLDPSSKRKVDLNIDVQIVDDASRQSLKKRISVDEPQVTQHMNLSGLKPSEFSGKLNENLRQRTNSSQWAELMPKTKTPRRLIK